MKATKLLYKVKKCVVDVRRRTSTYVDVRRRTSSYVEVQRLTDGRRTDAGRRDGRWTDERRTDGWTNDEPTDRRTTDGRTKKVPTKKFRKNLDEKIPKNFVIVRVNWGQGTGARHGGCGTEIPGGRSPPDPLGGQGTGNEDSRGRFVPPRTPHDNISKNLPSRANFLK